MLEQLKIQNQKGHEYQLNISSPSSNKLTSYFNGSTFLNKQEEISVFIKSFPQINLSQMKSPNTLISVLIKQNEMLSDKCQQQINMIKESFENHERLLKTNRQLKKSATENQRDSRELESKIKELEEKNNSIRQMEVQNRKIQVQCRKNIVQIKEKSEQVMEAKKIIQLLISGSYRKCEEYVKNSNLILNINLSLIETFCHKERKKNKYYGKIKSCTKQFCYRLNKIAQVMSAKFLTQELQKQTSAFLVLVQELIAYEPKKKKNKTQMSEQESSMFPSKSQIHYGDENGFFEKMILKIAQTAENNNQTKQQIAYELQNVKKSLRQSKQYYESCVKIMKKQYQTERQQKQNKLVLKEETINYYEMEIHKLRQSLDNLEDQNRVLQEEANRNKREVQLLSLELEQRIVTYKNKIQNMESEKRQAKYDFEQKIKQINDFNETKIKQRQQMIQQIKDKRKYDQQEIEKESKELKTKNKEMEEKINQKQLTQRKMLVEIQQLINKNTSISRTILQQNQKIQRLENEIKNQKIIIEKQLLDYNDLKSVEKEEKKEKQLQTAYIKELQAKIDTMNTKVKKLDIKYKHESAYKKEISELNDHFKEHLCIEKEKAEHLQSYCSELKDENQRFKIIIKEMKKQLQEVYIKVEQLKTIQIEREKLLEEVQQSQRNKSSFNSQCSNMKLEILKLQSQSKKNFIELKHYKNIVNRIQSAEYIFI